MLLVDGLSRSLDGKGIKARTQIGAVATACQFHIRAREIGQIEVECSDGEGDI